MYVYTFFQYKHIQTCRFPDAEGRLGDSPLMALRSETSSFQVEQQSEGRLGDSPLVALRSETSSFQVEQQSEGRLGDSPLVALSGLRSKPALRDQQL